MAKPTYYELLRDPLWRWKRDQVVAAAGYMCAECGAHNSVEMAINDVRFNVHHKYYRPDTLPWEYPDDCYVCLCVDCHDHRHVFIDKIKDEIGGMTVHELVFVLRNLKDFSRTVRDRPRTVSLNEATAKFKEGLRQVSSPVSYRGE